MILTEIDEFLKLLEGPTEDKIVYEKSVIHFQNYSFLFRNPYIKPRDSYVTVKFSSKFSSAGIWREVIKYSMENLDKIKSLDELNLEDTKQDFLYGGALKTLLPTLKFGGYETLFEVWMFVKTPEGYMFPATFYYGQSGTSFDGWRLDEAKKVFPTEFYSIINFSPFNFKPNELDAFIEALELSLKMVPVSDYYGIYKGDYGYVAMGVRNGQPYYDELGWVFDEVKGDINVDKRYYVEGYLEKQNFAIWCADCIKEQEIGVPFYPIFIDEDEDLPVCEICDKELKKKVVKRNNDLA